MNFGDPQSLRSWCGYFVAGSRFSPPASSHRPSSQRGCPNSHAVPHWSAVARSMRQRSEEHTSELQSLMRISYAVFCLKKKKKQTQYTKITTTHYANTHNSHSLVQFSKLARHA